MPIFNTASPTANIDICTYYVAYIARLTFKTSPAVIKTFSLYFNSQFKSSPFDWKIYDWQNEKRDWQIIASILGRVKVHPNNISLAAVSFASIFFYLNLQKKHKMFLFFTVKSNNMRGTGSNFRPFSSNKLLKTF